MLFVTLRRGLAGKSKEYLLTLKSLGLKKPRQEVAVPNDAGIRGQIEKVSSFPIEGLEGAPGSGGSRLKPRSERARRTMRYIRVVFVCVSASSASYGWTCRRPPPRLCFNGVSPFFVLTSTLRTFSFFGVQVKHLVSVETATQREVRLAAHALKTAPRDPLVVNH